MIALAHKEPDAETRLFKEYEGAARPYYQEVREYYSTGSIIFRVVGAPTLLAGQMPRYTLRAQAGQISQLFAYKIGDGAGIANMFTTQGNAQFQATKAETNLLEAYKTNTEDFAASGIGFQWKGIRLEMEAGDEFDEGVPADFRPVLLNGTGYIEDPGSHIIPPEVQSPLMLQDTLGRACMKKLNLREVWNARAEDDIALARGLGPIGAESYLNAQGEPSTYNCKRLDPGILWRMQNQSTDTKFNIEATLHEDVWSVVSWPQALVAPDEEDPLPFGALTRIHLDFQVILVGKAFYYPSQNAG